MAVGLNGLGEGEGEIRQGTQKVSQHRRRLLLRLLDTAAYIVEVSDVIKKLLHHLLFVEAAISEENKATLVSQVPLETGLSGGGESGHVQLDKLFIAVFQLKKDVLHIRQEQDFFESELTALAAGPLEDRIHHRLCRSIFCQVTTSFYFISLIWE